MPTNSELPTSMETHKDWSMNSSEEKIDLLALVKIVWIKRGAIALVVGLFFILGIFVAIFSPKTFTANSTFIPQTSEGSRGTGGLSGLASLTGLNLGGSIGGAEIPPSLYPKLTSSVSFKLKMLNAPINVAGVQEKVTYQEYFEKHYNPGLLSQIKKYTIGLPGVIIGAFNKKESVVTSKENEDSLITLTKEQVVHFNRLENQVSISHDAKEGLVELSVTMPEPLASAQMAKYAEELLQKAVIDYRIQNAKEQLEFTEKRYQEKKQEFEAIQKRLATFRDRNQNISSSLVLNQLQSLEAEFNLAFSVYTEVAKQLEQSKLQVSKDTPIFSVIQPVIVPVKKAGPGFNLILIIFLIAGFVVALVLVFGFQLFLQIKEQWNYKSHADRS